MHKETVFGRIKASSTTNVSEFSDPVTLFVFPVNMAVSETACESLILEFFMLMSADCQHFVQFSHFHVWHSAGKSFH